MEESGFMDEQRQDPERLRRTAELRPGGPPRRLQDTGIGAPLKRAIPLGWTLLAALGSCHSRGPELQRFEFREAHMGTEFSILLYAVDPASAEAASEAAFDRIEALDAALSDYDRESELSRVGQASDLGPLDTKHSISHDLYRVVSTARSWSLQTGGAFDPTVGPLTRLWRRARRQDELPGADRIRFARSLTGISNYLLLPPQGETPPRIQWNARGMRLDLGGIAKGYAIDEAMGVLLDHGIDRALVNGGGDLLAHRAPPGQVGWRVSVEDPGAAGRGAFGLLLEHRAVATSGDSQRGFVLHGTRYSHILDPRTGWALEHHQGATVVAPTAMTADALASALCVLTPEEGIELVAGLDGVEARAEWERNGDREACESPGFAGMMAPVGEGPSPQAPPRSAPESPRAPTPDGDGIEASAPRPQP